MIKGPIGIFDSGYGGLTILKEILAHPSLSKYDYIYLGDNARTPYGNTSKENIIKFSGEAVNFLFDAGARLIIFACFTASSLALRELQEKYLRDPKSKYKDSKILGVIRPIAEKAVHESKNGCIAVVGTRATISSGAFESELNNQKKDLKIFAQACPLLVPLIEEHQHKKPEARMILKKYLRPLKSKNADTIILGCTHYPLMAGDFKRMMGRRMHILDSGKIVAESLADYLNRHSEIESQLTANETRKFFTTDDAARFGNFAKDFADINISSAQKINLTA